MKKVLVVHPGAESSTHDVWTGVTDGLRAVGVPMAEFRLDGRINHAYDWLHYQWRQAKKRAKAESSGAIWPKPTPADVLLHASMGLVERALLRNCDTILVISAMFLQPDLVTIARRAGLKVYLLCTESPYAMDDERRLAAQVDGVWTNERTAVPALQTVCAHVAYLPHAWLTGVHDQPQPTDASTRAHDVVFVGTLFAERLQLLERVDWTGIDLGLYGNTELVPKRSPLARFVCGGVVPNAVAASLYRRAKIGLNLYRQTPSYCAAPAESLNPRAYELAAAGVCQLSEFRAEIRDRFGDTIPTFRTADELAGQMRTLLAEAPLRLAMGCEAQRLVAGQTWRSRIESMRRDLSSWAATAAQFPRSA